MRTKEEIRESLRKIVAESPRDVEADHGHADDLLCEMLELYGEHEFVADFDLLLKWYA